jgi:peptidoglycan/xylan/chitin deacetylase (PgdA/CDA1 family)
MYHGVVSDESPCDAWTLMRASEFERQLEFVRRHFTPLTMDQVLNPPGELKKPAVALTFDDGLRNNLRIALPLLESYETPATVYVSSHAIEDQQLFWWDRIILALQYSRAAELDLSEFRLGKRVFTESSARARWSDIQNLLESIQSDAYSDRESIAAHISMQFLRSGETQFDEFAVLTIDELRELASADLITIGSHTHTHDLLTRVSPEEARSTIELGVERLEGWLGAKIRHFAYPGGFYEAETMECLRELNVETAVTTLSGTMVRSTNPLEIPRISMGAYDRTLEWKANLLGLADSVAWIKGQRASS